MLNFDGLNELSLFWAKIIVMSSFVIALIFAFTFSRDYIFHGARDQKSWRNFKYWILIVVVVQLILYTVF